MNIYIFFSTELLYCNGKPKMLYASFSFDQDIKKFKDQSTFTDVALWLFGSVQDPNLGYAAPP